MVVQHNLTAMNSNRMLGVTTKTQSKTTEKLSSGYKINRAADDAAGLAISEKMRKQIRGLTQASANAQDGISAVQTAEGALTEVQDMLQRMNELAVKSSNGTQSESDRTSIQAEIDQLATEIDRVAETTKFNETYLLKGDRNVKKGYSYSYKAVSKENKVAAAKMDQDKATYLTAEITFKDGANAADQNAVAKALRDQGITITAKQNMDEKDAAKFQKEATYSVTLNGSAANIYKINTINDTGKNNGQTPKPGSDDINFNVSGKDAATFEIVDLQGNKIADIKIAGGIGADVAAESAKVITANTVEAAENKGDVKQFYDANGNAISENALGNYFSKLSEGGSSQTYYKKDGTVASADEVKAGAIALYTSLKAEAQTGNAGTSDLTNVSIKDVQGAAKDDVYQYAGGNWYCAEKGTGSAYNVGDVVEGITISMTGKVADGDKIKVTGADTKTVAGKDSSKAYFGTAEATGQSGTLYTEDGKEITNKDKLKEILDADTDAKLYTDTKAKKVSAKGNGGTGAEVAAVVVNEGVAAGIYQYVANANDDLPSGTGTANAAGWYSITDTATSSTASITGITGSTTDKVRVEVTRVGKTEATIDVNYTYKAGKATLDANQVAPLAGKQLYDAVGNALDGSKGIDRDRLTMALAAAEVASNQNLTGALSLNLHVGADATKNNQIDLKIDAMSAKGLGINGIRVDGRTDSNALKSIETIKEALAKVSAQRSALGAVQNRLEHTINNLDNVVENTTSAESAIRDTDMATTMVQFSNNNILTQAGTSMLAQANQSNQSVLSLLQ